MINPITLQLLGLCFGVIGQILTLTEPIKLRHDYGGIEVNPDGKENYEKRLRTRKSGIILTALGFTLQFVGIILSIQL